MTQNKPTGYCSSDRYTTLLSLLIVVNNIFARRGSRENKLPDIRNTITDKLNMSRWNEDSNRTYFSKFQKLCW